MQTLIDEAVWQFANRTVHEIDFQVFRHLCVPDGLFVDIGANRGQSAISFHSICPKAAIVSFEANPFFVPVLAYIKDRLLPDYAFHISALSDTRGQRDLLVPEVDGVLYLQESSLDPANYNKSWVRDRLKGYGSNLNFSRIQVETAVFDDWHLRPGVIKIDVEGVEASVLRGMEGTIVACHPVFLIENSDWRVVTAFLEAHSYRCYMYEPEGDALIPLSGTRANSLYVWEREWPFHLPRPA